MTVFHGILRAGGAATTVNSLYTAAEITAQLRDARATYLFTISAFLDRADEAARPVAGSRPIGSWSCWTAPTPSRPAGRSCGSCSAAGAAAPDLDLDPATALAVLPYSSGTTAVPKGVHADAPQPGRQHRSSSCR